MPRGQARRFLSVVIPTYNEAHRLPRTLDEILPYLDAHFSFV